MGTRVQPNKVLLDIEDCIVELKRQSLDGRTPINDDSSTLHRLQEKLELILLSGLIEKPGLLGPKKSYWSYICSCFASSKRSHDGINYVKSVASIKTPLGRGRAFIRFCLTQKCLADTLQSCFMNQKISREFYVERSLPVQEKLWSALVSSLYELNELNFDLCAGHMELDVSWPKFARKLFAASDNENFLHKNMSSPNLLTSSKDEFLSDNQDADSFSFDMPYNSSDSVLTLDSAKLTEINKNLSEQNKSLQIEVNDLENEKLKLQCDIQNLQKECLELRQQLKSSWKEQSNDNKSTQVSVDMKDQECNSSFIVPENSTVKSKIASDTDKNSSKHTFLKSEFEVPERTLDSDVCTIKCEKSENKARCIPQNPIYINELLLEMKTVIDDVEDTVQKCDGSLAIPHISRLRKIRNCLEEKFSSEVDNSKNYSNFGLFVENCITCIKNFITKQDNVIQSLQERVDLSIKENQNLFSRIKTLRELLQSYGFLKITSEKSIEPVSVFLPFDASPVSPKFSCKDFSCDIAHDPVLKRVIVPLLPVLNSSFTKLNNLNEKMTELQFGLGTSQELNNHLISRVQDQEMHLKGVTKEIEEAQQLVSILKKQHKKLQSAEGVLRYDLQEKRKLLTRLKQQLENTHEDFNRVRIKNSKSEAEWQDLHKEFAERHKQASEESGFSDDKGFDDPETVFPDSSGDCSSVEENVPKENSVNENTPEMIQANKRKRLELLEEQCQNLYSSLLQSSKRRQDIDKRLENMCKTVEKNSGIVSSNMQVNGTAAENDYQNVDSDTIETKDNCQNVLFTSDTLTNSPHSSSDVGSLNSECSSCLPSLCNDVHSSDSCICDSSKADSCISVSPCKLQIDAVPSLNDQVIESDSLHDSVCTISCDTEYEDHEIVPLCQSVEITTNESQSSQLQNISHVDSILIKKKDLEESLKKLQIRGEIESTKPEKFSNSKEHENEISALKDDKIYLLKKIEELEKKILIVTTDLDRTTQQLMISKASQEHEVASLQFQLNSEALKYERALKEFSEQSKGLENMKQRVTEQEKLILALEEALSEIHADRENEKEHRWQELEDIHIALDAREQECITLTQELEKSMSEVEEEHSRNEMLLSQLEAIKAYNQRDKEQMETEILHLTQYSRELQKKLIKLLKEKDILWKRNDHMYHLQKTKIDDRWMKDSEVSSCLACKNDFSFILRKHHCRLCGRIFCYLCANNWLMTASSSKKIRACNECFVQHMEIKKVVRRGSDVPHIDDESDDEAERDNAGLSFIPTSSDSFHSDIPSSINNSVISLPITQKLKTPHFASAPDLRYVSKNSEPNEASLISTSLLEDPEFKGENKPVTNGSSRDVEQNTDISSDDCTSITLEDEASKTCKLEEIKTDHLKLLKDGIRGTVVFHPGEDVELPIICQTCPVILQWSFITDCQDFPFTVTCQNENHDSTSVVCHQSTNKKQDQMELTVPGYYVFHFDNSSRTTDVLVEYTIMANDLN